MATISYHDANLNHNIMTGRSATAVLHMLNKTPIDWHSKKQDAVETATCGSEFSSAQTCVEQTLDLRIALRHAGVPLQKLSCMLGCNDSVVNSSMTPFWKIHKRHAALSFHRVREAIATKIISCQFIDGKTNPADILSKHWAHRNAWPTLKPLLFWKGDTMEHLDNSTLDFEE